jgi:hypothetical protein
MSIANAPGRIAPETEARTDLPGSGKAGQDSTGAAALKSGSLALTANTENSVAVTGLTGNTAYDVYFVATGTANNDQTSVTKKDVQTLVRGTVVTIQ